MRLPLALMVALTSCMVTARLPKALATLKLSKSAPTAGGKFMATIEVTFPSGYHGYQNPPSEEFEIPLTIESEKNSKFKLAKITYPKGELMSNPGDPKPTAVYSGTIEVPIWLKAPTSPGTYPIKLKVGYQQCNRTSCLPPDTISLTGSVRVLAAAKKGSKHTKS